MSVIDEIQKLALEGLCNDGHKQWYLEEILKLIISERGVGYKLSK